MNTTQRTLADRITGYASHLTGEVSPPELIAERLEICSTCPLFEAGSCHHGACATCAGAKPTRDKAGFWALVAGQHCRCPDRKW